MELVVPLLVAAFDAVASDEAVAESAPAPEVGG
jgi:hypothetical protein